MTSVQGMPLGTGVACGGLVTQAGSAGVRCTANGWVCPNGA